MIQGGSSSFRFWNPSCDNHQPLLLTQVFPRSAPENVSTRTTVPLHPSQHPRPRGNGHVSKTHISSSSKNMQNLLVKRFHWKLCPPTPPCSNFSARMPNKPSVLPVDSSTKARRHAPVARSARMHVQKSYGKGTTREGEVSEVWWIYFGYPSSHNSPMIMVHCKIGVSPIFVSFHLGCFSTSSMIMGERASNFAMQHCAKLPTLTFPKKPPAWSVNTERPTCFLGRLSTIPAFRNALGISNCIRGKWKRLIQSMETLSVWIITLREMNLSPDPANGA